ncbi:MAG: 2-hydroxyacyl-CoA dehydratase family protein [Mesotoga sp.]|uniref:2-hydroxyacyl-CoA dehydratase subunit D n=1 Tax=Mesotoga sp. TaxID=2053577 RepID=UPI00261788C2|nr:2-hydroxyacyl-CoA dehydratase family protein [Mesotoga sp.]MDD5683747.1 2-hydroxyacyl-CoA dehydratase family protein [Mesotoga sp.]
MSGKSVKFGSFLRNYIDDTDKFKKWLQLGMGFENFRRRHFPDRDRPRFVNTVNHLALEEVYLAIKGSSTVWVNLMAPSELLLSAGLNPVSAEGISGALSSMHLEDTAIAYSSQAGISDSLCTFHRASLGVSMRKLLPPPKLVMTTSILCDGNLPTFKRIAREYDVPFILIDVPRGRKPEAVGYVVSQLKAVIGTIEEITGTAFKMEELSMRLSYERELMENLEEIKSRAKDEYLPQHLYEHMNSLYVLHTLAGDSRIAEASRSIGERLEAIPENARKVLWLHIPPYYDNELFNLFLPGSKNLVVANELMWDWMYPVDPQRPLESLAEKLVYNPLCGSVVDRGDFCLDLARNFSVDGVIHFSHWGCRQSAGGVSYLKKVFEEESIPFLELTGDCVDHASQGAGQLRTRTEAFLEIMEKRK